LAILLRLLGGVQAMVVEPIGALLTPAQFREAHQIRDPEPPADPAPEPENGDDGEDYGEMPDIRNPKN
jgi:hypothetical protein